MTYFVLTFGTFFYFIYFWNELRSLLLFIGFIIAIIQNVSYLYTSLINPGLGKDQEIDYYSTSKRNCNRCNISYERHTTLHCTYCDICIYQHDHHCPWTGKCIGQKNKISFYVFISFTMVLLVYFFLAIVISSARREAEHRKP